MNELLEKENAATGETPPADERREGTAQPGGEAAPQGEGPKAPETPSGPQGPAPSVFAPAPWDLTAQRQAAARRQEERTARREEADARRREEKAAQAAREQERKAAQEQRKAQEEQRRQEDRRRQEEEREHRREEKAQRKTVRRVGTMTLGVSLIAIGVAILLYMLYPAFDISLVAYLAPVILISLGLEVLVRYFFHKDGVYQYDFASGIICVFLVMGSFCVALLPQVMYYIGPERFASEKALVQQAEDQVYQALLGDQRVGQCRVNGGIDAGAPGRQDENGHWLYELAYTDLQFVLLDPSPSEEDFARTCRELLDKLDAQGVLGQPSTSVYFSSPYNEEGESYQLVVNSRLQMELTAENLAKLTEITVNRPSRANGWYPAGYDELQSEYGTQYAEHFADLMENYGTDQAALYYDLLELGLGEAENYYRYLTAEREASAVAGTAEQAEEPPEEPPVEEPPAEDEPPAEEAGEGGTETETPPSMAVTVG